MKFDKNKVEELIENCKDIKNCEDCKNKEFCDEVEKEMNTRAWFETWKEPKDYGEDEINWLTA
jgi:site-specific DNA-adenine methylase